MGGIFECRFKAGHTPPTDYGTNTAELFGEKSVL